MKPAEEFPIPKELTALIANGFWPTDKQSANRQNLHSIVPKSSVQKFAPEETGIFFYPLPFSTVRAHMKGGDSFWPEFGAIQEIDPDKMVLIGDFGLGSDAPIALDYRKNESEPTVLRLRWGGEGNHWIEVAPNFAVFATYIKIDFTSPSAG